MFICLARLSCSLSLTDNKGNREQNHQSRALYTRTSVLLGAEHVYMSTII
jgi:hypothetical protein